MAEYWATVAILMAIAIAILWPVSTWFGYLLTQEPPDLRGWLRQILSTKTLQPRTVVVSMLAVVPTSSSTMSAATRDLVSGSKAEIVVSTIMEANDNRSTSIFVDASAV